MKDRNYYGELKPINVPVAFLTYNEQVEYLTNMGYEIKVIDDIIIYEQSNVYYKNGKWFELIKYETELKMNWLKTNWKHDGSVTFEMRYDSETDNFNDALNKALEGVIL